MSHFQLTKEPHHQEGINPLNIRSLGDVASLPQASPHVRMNTACREGLIQKRRAGPLPHHNGSTRKLLQRPDSVHPGHHSSGPTSGGVVFLYETTWKGFFPASGTVNLGFRADCKGSRVHQVLRKEAINKPTGLAIHTLTVNITLQNS